MRSSSFSTGTGVTASDLSGTDTLLSIEDKVLECSEGSTSPFSSMSDSRASSRLNINLINFFRNYKGIDRICRQNLLRLSASPVHLPSIKEDDGSGSEAAYDSEFVSQTNMKQH